MHSGLVISQEVRRLLKNFISLVTGTLLIRLLSVIATLYITKTLGPADFGVLSFALALTLVISVCANFGLEELIVRDVARQSDKVACMLGDAIILKSLVVLPLGALFTILLILYNRDHGWLYLFIVACSLFQSFVLVFAAVFRGIERMELQTVLATAQMFVTAVASILVVRFTRNVTAVAFCYLAVAIVTVGIGYALMIKKGIRPQYRWQPANFKPLFMTALPFGFAFLSGILHDRLSVIFVAILSGEVASGWFNAVNNIILIMSSLPSIVALTMFPLLARRALDLQTVTFICAKLIKYGLVTSLGLALMLYAIAPTIVPLLFGQDYQPSVQILQILAASLPFLFTSLTLVGVLEAVNQQQNCAFTIAKALGFAVPCCLVLTWLLGYKGGAWAYVINYGVLSFLLLRLTINTVGRFEIRKALASPVIATTITGVLVYLGRDWPLPLLVPAFVACYCVLLLLTGTLGAYEVDMLRKIRHNPTASTLVQPALGSAPNQPSE